jgi:hypothetical protein
MIFCLIHYCYSEFETSIILLKEQAIFPRQEIKKQGEQTDIQQSEKEETKQTPASKPID